MSGKPANSPAIAGRRHVHIPHSVIVRAPGLFRMPYTISELANQLGVSRRTLLTWVRYGLPSHPDKTHPGQVLVVGTELAAWVEAIRQERRRPKLALAPDEMYCLACKRAVTPASITAETPSGKTLRRTACCPHCGKTISRAIGPREGTPINDEPAAPTSRNLRPQELQPVSRENYLLVREFEQQHLSQLYNPATRTRYVSYLRHLLLWAGTHPLISAHTIQPDFRHYLESARQDGSGRPLKFESVKKITWQAREFFLWLKSEHPTPCRRIQRAWIERLQPPRSRTAGGLSGGNVSADGDATAAVPPAQVKAVPLDDILKIAALPVPADDLVMRRDQAAACFLFTSGMRAGAFATLPIKAFDPEKLTVAQRPELGVHTKNRKSAITSLYIIPELLAIILAWDGFIRAKLPASAMWFTPIHNNWGDKTLLADPPGPSRPHQVIKAIRRICSAAGVPYHHPHTFRHGHAVHGLAESKVIADYKSVSLNLMHADLFITDRIYSILSADDVRARIQALSQKPLPAAPAVIDPQALAQVLAPMMAEALKQALKDSQP